MLAAPAPNETRVVFMGDSITEGWGMKATDSTPQRARIFSQQAPTSIAGSPVRPRRK